MTKKKKKSRSALFWTGSLTLPGVPIVGFLAEQAMSSLLPRWAAGVPWPWLAASGLALWIGYALYDLTAEDSRLRAWFSDKFGLAEVEIAKVPTHNVSAPLSIVARVSLKQFAAHFGCYVRVAELVPFIDGTAKWEWSEQFKIEEGTSLQKGRVFDISLLTLRREEGRKGELEVVGRARTWPYSHILQFEIVVSSQSHRPDPTRYTLYLSDGYSLHEVDPDQYNIVGG